MSKSILDVARTLQNDIDARYSYDYIEVLTPGVLFLLLNVSRDIYIFVEYINMVFRLRRVSVLSS